MRKLGGLIVVLAILGSPSLSYADVIWIPMPTKVKMFKKLMKERGLDLSGTDEADGHVEDHGTKIKIVTHRWMEMDELDKIKEAAVLARR